MKEPNSHLGTPYTGKAYENYENGSKMLEMELKEGKLNGVKNSYYEDGKKQYEETYAEGKKNGKSTDWNDKGVLINENVKCSPQLRMNDCNGMHPL